MLYLKIAEYKVVLFCFCKKIGVFLLFWEKSNKPLAFQPPRTNIYKNKRERFFRYIKLNMLLYLRGKVECVNKH